MERVAWRICWGPVGLIMGKSERWIGVPDSFDLGLQGSISSRDLALNLRGLAYKVLED